MTSGKVVFLYILFFVLLGGSLLFFYISWDIIQQNNAANGFYTFYLLWTFLT